METPWKLVGNMFLALSFTIFLVHLKKIVKDMYILHNYGIYLNTSIFLYTDVKSDNF